MKIIQNCFHVFIDSQISDIIIKFTNKKINVFLYKQIKKVETD